MYQSPLIGWIRLGRVMPNRKNYAGEPFARCVTCENRKVACRGMDTSDLPLETWRAFMRAVKEYEGYTYAELSERTQPQIAERTIEKKLAPGGDGQDLMRETRRAIENAVLGTAYHKCYRNLVESLPADKKSSADLEAEMALLRRNIEMIHASYQKELELVRQEAREKIDYLRAENEKKDKIIDRLLR